MILTSRPSGAAKKKQQKKSVTQIESIRVLDGIFSECFVY